MSGEIIRKGDSTSHGGTVLEGSPVDICHGKPIAYIGHMVSCPKCKGNFPIIEGVVVTTFYGKGVAIAGMKTACGALLIPTQFTDIVEYGAGRQSQANGGGGSHHPSEASTTAVSTAVAGGDGVPASTGPAFEAPLREKAVSRMFWTYGSDEQPVDDVSRHYVDLNLHVETRNYDAGELVHVSIMSDTASEGQTGSRTLQAAVPVGADGTGKIVDVFKGKTLEIGVLE